LETPTNQYESNDEWVVTTSNCTLRPLYKGIQIEAMLANKFDYENPFMPIQTCLTL
jgi:hypothetical protein